MARSKTVKLKSFILKLLSEEETINLQQIAKKSGLDVNNATDRRAIQRVLKQLIEAGSIEAKGYARTRVYLLKNNLYAKKETIPSRIKATFLDIPLSTEAKKKTF
jgi:hypothetical protein